MDADNFRTRIARLYKTWKSDPDSFGSADHLVIVHGKSNQEIIFRKSIALQLWLTGFELTDTLIMLSQKKMFIIGGKKKIEILRSLESLNLVVPLSLTILERDANQAKKQVAALIKEVLGESAKPRVGAVVKDFAEEGIMQIVPKTLRELAGCEIIDCSLGFSIAMASRSSSEIEMFTNAATVSDLIVQKQILPAIERSLDEGVDVTHSRIADDAEQLFAESTTALESLFASINLKLEPGECESCFTPIIQSGGTFDLRPSAFSSDENLSPDVIIITTGARYGSYCSSVARTYFINPEKSIESAYNVLLQVREACLEAMRPGHPANDVWKAAINVIRNSSRHSVLLPAFTKNCGFLTGQEYRDSSFMLNSRNSSVFKENMVFILSVGFNGLKSKKKTASMLLNDTVVITNGPANCLTKSKFALSSVSYKLEIDEDEDDDEAIDIPTSMILDDNGPRTRATRSGGKVDLQQQEKEEKRKRAQQELIERKQEQARLKYSEDADHQDTTVRRVKNAVVQAYDSVREYPRDASKNQIYVDMQRESILVPINGRLVPFHITFIKSVSTQEMGSNTYLRINLTAPGSAQAAQALQPYADHSKVFIKELTFRATDDRNLNKSLRLIKELQKRISQQEKERSDRASFVEQAPLQLNRDPRYDFKLRDLQIRPNLGGKKLTGTLQTHRDGMLFSGNKGQKLEVLYRNIKHAFFQPCDNTISVLLHFELHSPIIIAKKRTNFVQFFLDVVESSQDLVGANRKGQYDRDGIQEEQQERIRRNRFNEKFREFARNIEDVVAALDSAHKFEFDIPYREIMFPGVPNKTNVNVLPTVHALVALDDAPPFVMFLDEVEIAYFERVQFHLRNFDLVFVFKDFEKPIVKIRSIPRDHLESIQQYLTESDIAYFVGAVNLQWNNILKVVKDDAAYFFTEQGGWASILGSKSDDENSSQSEQESEYDEDGEEDEFEEDDENSEEYESNEMTEEDEDEEEDEEEGPTWEELERDAIQEEQERAERRGREESNDDSRRPSKRPKKSRK